MYQSHKPSVFSRWFILLVVNGISYDMSDVRHVGPFNTREEAELEARLANVDNFVY